MREVGRVYPGFEIGAGIDLDDELLCVRHYHHPVVLVPDNLGIPKLRARTVDYRVAIIILERVASVERNKLWLASGVRRQ